MHSLSSPSSLLLPVSARHPSRLLLSLQHRQFPFDGAHRHGCSLSPDSLSFSSKSSYSFHHRPSSVSATTPSNEGAVSVINLKDFHEKDWSFLESMELNTVDHAQKIQRIIKAGEISESSRVLVSISSESFIDRLVESSPSQCLLVVHDSLFVLAGIKEKYDSVKCWQGELICLPEKWSALDVVFLYFLPALPFKLNEIFKTLARHCSPGARIVISHPGGREGLEQQRKQSSDVVISELPDKTNLQNMAKKHSFELAEFVDELGLYLAALRYSGA